MNKPGMTCPGYERKGWFNSLCRWYYYGQDRPGIPAGSGSGLCMKFINDTLEPDKWDTNCPTQGHNPYQR